MISEAVRTIDGFPEKLASELKHCVIAHHGELEYGSPKKPALLRRLHFIMQMRQMQSYRL